MNNIVLVSGGFDPVHIGHVRMFKEAAKLGTLYVGLNSDEWLMRKKGYVFMPWEERAEIISSFACVHCVESFSDKDDTCLDWLRKWRRITDAENGWAHLIFCNGGDRNMNTTPEDDFCEEAEIEVVYGVGGDGKIQSSSDLVRNSILRRSDNIGSDWLLHGPQGSD